MAYLGWKALDGLPRQVSLMGPMADMLLEELKTGEPLSGSITANGQKIQIMISESTASSEKKTGVTTDMAVMEELERFFSTDHLTELQKNTLSKLFRIARALTTLQQLLEEQDAQ